MTAMTHFRDSAKGWLYCETCTLLRGRPSASAGILPRRRGLEDKPARIKILGACLTVPRRIKATSRPSPDG